MSTCLPPNSSPDVGQSSGCYRDVYAFLESCRDNDRSCELLGGIVQVHQGDCGFVFLGVDRVCSLYLGDLEISSAARVFHELHTQSQTG